MITIKTKIIASDSAKTMVIPKTIFDTGSDSSLVSSNIVKRLELDMDKTNALNLSGPLLRKSFAPLAFFDLEEDFFACRRRSISEKEGLHKAG